MSHRRSLPLALLAAAVVTAAGCGQSAPAPQSPSDETDAPPPPETTTTAAPATSAAPTTTAAPSTTLPREPWLEPGRAYYFPVQPPDAAEYGRDHHDYPATDIFAAAGTPVVAVVAGVVDEVDTTDEWDAEVDDPASRSGLYVTIVGDDGVRYHASHLDAVSSGLTPGVRVYAGQQIGTVGNSGNAATTPSHVHFGISHPTFPGDWEVRRGEVWPWPYLDAWREGEDLVPSVEG